MGGNRGDNDDEREAVARYMLFYYKKSKADQQQIIMDWIKYTSHNKNRRIYCLPIADRLKTTINPINEEYITKLSNLGSYTVCLLTCAKAVETNTIPQHGNSNLQGGRGKVFDEFIKADLVDFLEMLKREKAET